VTPVREWQARFGTRGQLRPGVEEPTPGRDRVRLLERRVRLLVVVVGVLTVLVIVLAVALLRAQG
jgi:hypothetical protein